MSIAVTYAIFCDGEDCCWWEPDSQAPTRQDSWAIARSHGWVRRKGKHLCPQCSGKLTPEKEELRRSRVLPRS